MDEMNTMNEVMDTENTDMVPTQDENLVMTEDNAEDTSSGIPAMLVVGAVAGAVALAGYGIGKLGEKVIRKKVAPAIKAKVAGLKKHKGAEESEPVDVEVEATEVEPEEETK